MRKSLPLFRRTLLLFTLVVLCVNLSGCYFVMHEKVERKMKENTVRIDDLEKRVRELEKQQAEQNQHAQPAKPLP